jgi:hypothetical protein
MRLVSLSTPQSQANTQLRLKSQPSASLAPQKADAFTPSSRIQRQGFLRHSLTKEVVEQLPRQIAQLEEWIKYPEGSRIPQDKLASTLRAYKQTQLAITNLLTQNKHRTGDYILDTSGIINLPFFIFNKGAKLNYAQLCGAYLEGAELEGVNLAHAQLQDANLTGSNLRNSLLNRADLTGADLTGADLTGTECYLTNFKETNLTEAIGHKLT